MLLIPSIDLRNGRCVRLLRGDFNAETVYERTPESVFSDYRALGVKWLHLVDLDGARDGRLANRDAILSFARSGAEVQVGGGVRSRAVAQDLLDQGVARVAVGSAAVESPIEVAEWLRHYGPQRICLALDVRLDAAGLPRLYTRGWREASALDLWSAIEQYQPHGLRHVLCTDIDRDGALEGPNLSLYAECVSRFPQISWQASGGVSSAADLEHLAAIGVAATISGKALLDGHIDANDMQRWLSV